MTNIPKHIAIIMDGNRRWAKKRGLPSSMGHAEGANTLEKIADDCSDLGIKYLTVYAFSTENWKRSQEEVGGIFNLLVKFVGSELAELDENNVKVHILGEYREKVPGAAVASIDRALETTADNDGLQFNIALNYGSRAEITRAVKRICHLTESGVIKSEEVTEEMIAMALYTGNDNGNIPDPDLIIRTSGEERLSNFLLWQAAYSEFAFTDTLWPDFTPEEFESIIEEFSTRGRRFGGRI